ncbi:MAG TPA: response regulator [Tepidisphaeraceae bacterium]|jgi:two-component system copper resistance phosphate regulon response regulator CusR
MRILVVEDHPLLGQSITDGLREEGYAVDHVTDGGDALHLAQARPYDGIVLDVLLPQVDGWTVLQTLRRKSIDTPVLCLTALGSVEDRVRGLQLGSDDYLVKPFAWTEFLARVQAIIRRGHSKSSPLITVGDLEVDTAKKGVRRAGKRIELTAREYTLLEFLAHRCDQVVSRQEICDHLYDQNEVTTTNVVDVYIRYLRLKIDEPFDSKLIHTHRGQGYMLSANPE